MATDVAVGDIIQARIEYLSGNQVAYNIFHFQITSLSVTSSGLPPATAVPFANVTDGIGQHVYDTWVPAWQSEMSSQCTVTGVTTQDIYPPVRSRPFTYSPAVPDGGLVVGDMLPLQDAVTLLKQSNFGTRWGLGRTYVPGIPENRQNAGIINPVLAASMETLADVFLGVHTFTAGDFTLGIRQVLFKPSLEGAPRITPVVTGQLSDEVIKTQRRRRPGKGI